MPAFKALTHFGDISLQEFLADFWQKKPKVFKQAFTDFQCPVSADELAGFALDDALPSRIVLQHAEHAWEVQHGPFKDDHFQHLPSSAPWTLLVQHLDSLVPELAALLQAFSFLPRWRLEDIMMSYATDQAGVGPHFDYYDVFLIQAQGTRRWKLGQTCDSNTALLPDQPMKILASFQEKEAHLMQVGDVLYVPPGVAHWGISEGEGLTISVGFRAPSYAELLMEYAEEQASLLTEDSRYRDISLSTATDQNEIPAQALQHLQEELLNLCQNKDLLARSFGKLMTRPNLDFETDEPATPLQDLIAVKLRDEVRTAWIKQNNRALLFLDGEDFNCDLSFASRLANRETLALSALGKQELILCQQLFVKGFLESI